MQQFRYGVVNAADIRDDRSIPAGRLLAAANDYELLLEAADAPGANRLLVRLDPLVPAWSVDDDEDVVRVDGYLPLTAWPELAGDACNACGWHDDHEPECWFVETDADGIPLAPLNDGNPVYCVGCGTLWQAPPWRGESTIPDLCDGPCPGCHRDTLSLDIPTPGQMLQVAFAATESSAKGATDWRQTFVDVWGEHLDVPPEVGS